MKFIHCSDIHLDSKMESNLPQAKSRQRKKELVLSFLRMIDIAVENSVTAVMIAGDLFDTNVMSPATRDLIIGKMAEAKDVDFLYLCGNHDAGKELCRCQLPENVKLFSDRWQSYKYGDTVISGVELTAENCHRVYDELLLDKDAFNIVMMHGQIGTAEGEELINRNLLAGKGIDYLALGHYHTRKIERLDDRGAYAYSGCLEGRGFDECGEKGFYLLNVEEGKLGFKQMSVAERRIELCECDISDISDASLILGKITEAVEGIPETAMVKVVLTGEVPSDQRRDTEFFLKALSDKFYFAKIEDKTRIKLCPDDYLYDVSLKGEFIRKVYESDLPEDIRDAVIVCGLGALGKAEVL